MNDLFRALFGFPPNGTQGHRMNDRPPNDFRNNFRGNERFDDDEDNDDNMNMDAQGGIFGFSLFEDSIEIHQRFQRLVNDMNKVFGIFRFNNGPSITWEDGNSNISSFLNEELIPKEESLRDTYLKKPDCVCDQNHQREEFNVNLKDDFQPGTSNKLNAEVQISYPKIYSKSIFIQTVTRSDGTIETIKKVRDHTGNEKTTIMQSNVNESLPPQEGINLMPKEDNTTGISIFRKFFPF